ncbi:MAG: signal peptide peptidase SppA [Bacteroidota bacterium]
MKFLSTLFASVLGTLAAIGILFFFGLLILFAFAAASDPAPQVQSSSVLVMRLDQGIAELNNDASLLGALQGGGGLDLVDIQNALRMAAVDDRIEGVWLQTRVVSGGWATMQEVRQALLAYADSGKPLIASSSSYITTEADYYLASTADSVFATPEALFEFNGFFLSGEFYAKGLEMLGVEPQIIRTGKYKSAIEPYTRTDYSPENEEQLTAILTNQNQVFLDAIADSRGMDVAALDAIIQNGTVGSAVEAEAAGLLDGLRYDSDVEAWWMDRLDSDRLRTIDAGDYARSSSAEAGLENHTDGEIALVYAVGAITNGTSGFSANPLLGGETLGTETFVKAMDDARETDRVKAIVLRVSSPGGFAPAADVMLDAIERARAEKPVIVSMGDVAASGGYWIAATADTIVASPLTITGSIGAFGMMISLEEFLEDKLGITYDFIATGPYADVYSGIQPLSPAQEAFLARSNDELYERFVNLVAEGRGMTPEAAEAVSQGRVWSGVDAQRVGLVDVLGGLRTALDLAAERAELAPGYRVRVLPRPKTAFEELADLMNAQASTLWQRATLTDAERTLLRQAETLRLLREMHGTNQLRMPMTLEIR